jgi:hypothetical protein
VRQVDSSTLENVDRIAGSTSRGSQLTEFQDELLQQVLDVGPILSGLGLHDGWLAVGLENAHTAAGTMFDFADPYLLLEQPQLAGPAARDHYRVWVVAMQLERDVPAAGNSIDDAAAGYQIPAISPIQGMANYGVVRATTFGGVLQTGNRQIGLHTTTGEYAFQHNVPMMIPPGGVLLLSSTATWAAGTEIAQAQALLWAGLRGMKPPVRVGQ